MAENAPLEENKKSLNFIEQIIEKDLSEGKNNGRVQTRFPPEPNGYLHIGHAKAICLDFGIAEKYRGVCNLRFDDTNPTKEDVEYVDSIQEDIRWLGFRWENIFYASDYFQQLFDFAVSLIQKGKAYVDEQSAEAIAAQKGTPTQAGTDSPYRNRPTEESLDLFLRMNRGDFEEGAMTLRAKIDMASPNMHFRDPIIYRIIKTPHHRTGRTWNVYPMYDFAHGQSDYFEGVTHSLCTLEFEVHRPLYDYFIDLLIDSECGKDGDYRPRQTEFNRLNLTYTVMSKRKLLQLVKEKLVNGWDDPRMPTISGLRRRGFTAAALRNFCHAIGVAKANSLVDAQMLEHEVRADLNENADRVMAVLHPLKVVITNYPEDKKEMLLAENNPLHGGHRFVPFSREIYIDQEDFMEEPPKKYFRLKPGGEVRLKHAYIIKCEEVIKDAAGCVTELHCTADLDSKTGGLTAGRKIKGTIHWVDAKAALSAEVRLYDNLIETDESGNIPDDFIEALNKDSLEVIEDARIEPSVRLVAEGTHYQFLRVGYFVVDPDTTPDHIVFNRVVGLRDSWAKVKK